MSLGLLNLADHGNVGGSGVITKARTRLRIAGGKYYQIARLGDTNLFGNLQRIVHGVGKGALLGCLVCVNAPVEAGTANCLIAWRHGIQRTLWTEV